jgi:iron(III) transport system permease protein
MKTFDLDYLNHFMRTAAGTYMGTTLILTLGVTCGSLLIGGCTSWFTSHYEFRGRDFLQWGLILPLAFPSDVIALVYRETTAYYGPLWQLIKIVSGYGVPLQYWFVEMESWGGLIFVLSLSFYPFVYIILYTAWRAQPRSYSEIGASLGLSPARAALKITLPLALPAILVSCLVAGFLALNDYGTSILFGKRGIAVAIHNMWHGFDRPIVASQLVAMLIIGVYALLLLAGWYLSSRHYYDPIVPKGLKPQATMGRLRGSLAFLGCSLPVFLGFLLPLGMLISWAVPRMGKVDFSKLLFFVKNSLSVSILATFICLILALFFVLKDMGKPYSNRSKLYFIPSISLSVGVLLLLSWAKGMLVFPLLSNSITALVYAMCVRLFCLSFLSVSIGRKKVPPRIDDLLHYLHRGFAYRIGRVYLPLLREWILVGGLITFISALKELNLSLALAPVNYVSLSTRIYFFTTHEMVKESAVWCLTIVIMALYPVIMISRKLTNMDKLNAGDR